MLVCTSYYTWYHMCEVKRAAMQRFGVSKCDLACNVLLLEG